MRILIILILLTVYIKSNSENTNPYKSLKFDKVVMYDFKESEEASSLIIDSSGKFLQLIINQVVLDSITISKFNNKVGDIKSYGLITAECFNPHCGLVYYYKKKIVAQITICLLCNRLYSTISIPAQKQGKKGKGKEIYYTLDGLSKSFQEFIKKLLIKYNFSQHKNE